MEINRPPQTLNPRQTDLGMNRRKDDRVQKAEREAMERVKDLETQVGEAERAARSRMEHMKDEYVRQTEAESARQSESLEQTRQENYQELRSMKRRHNEQVNHMRRESEAEIANLKNYYDDTTRRLVRRGDEQQNELQRTHQRQREYEESTRRLEQETTALEHSARMQEIRERNEEAFLKLKTEEEARYENARTKSQEASEQAETYFSDRFKDIVEEQNAVLEDTYRRTHDKLNEIRTDTSSKLRAFSNRNRDPFYQLVELDASIRDHGDSFVLRANIPPHEQGNIAVAVRGNEVVVSGYRRSEDALKTEDGKSLRTASFQSFSESFPVNYPIDARNVQRSYDGNTLTITFPKLPAYAKAEGYKAKSTLDMLRVERPFFPRQLPINPEDTERKPAEEAPTRKPGDLKIRKPRGGGTLS